MKGGSPILGFPPHTSLFGCHEKKMSEREGGLLEGASMVCHLYYCFLIVPWPPYQECRQKESSLQSSIAKHLLHEFTHLSYFHVSLSMWYKAITYKAFLTLNFWNVFGKLLYGLMLVMRVKTMSKASESSIKWHNIYQIFSCV